MEQLSCWVSVRELAGSGLGGRGGERAVYWDGLGVAGELWQRWSGSPLQQQRNWGPEEPLLC